MMGFESAEEVPLTARYHRQAIEQLVQCVDEGVYCALLGPRLSGKTVLLRFVDRYFREELKLTSVYIDLMNLRVSTLHGFFAELIQQITHRLRELTSARLPERELAQANSAIFRGFLADSAALLERDLVLIIEHLEAAPMDLVQALLTSLRAAYMDQQTMDYRVTVVVSGALSLATLTVGESSPFRGIARRVFVGDLSAEDSQAMIDEFLEEEGIYTTPQARQRLLEATRGDAYLIRSLCQRSLELVWERELPRLGATTVHQVTGSFLRREVFQYAPLLEAVRLIEEDPDLLRCILMLLASDLVRKSELPLPLSPDLDPLYLTGVVEPVQEDSYRVQNLIYRRFLEQHFYPGHVGHMLAMAGRWDDALDYLEVGVEDGDEGARSDLLPATINSMYAADDPAKAAHFLARGIMAGFGVHQVHIWYAPPQENRLRLICQVGGDGSRPSLELPVSADELEARAFRQRASLRGQESDKRVRRAIPLVIRGSKPIGVVTLWEEMVLGHFLEQRQRDVQLASYLRQAARALLTVGTRRQELVLAGRMQASLLPLAPPDLPGWIFSAAWKPARETSGDFYDFIPLPEGKWGLVIADVVDKGMGAALYMALSRTLIRTYAAQHPERPDLALRAANVRILQDVGATHFVTVFFGILDPTSGELVYCNAGHNPPYLFCVPSGSPERTLIRTGMALGVEEEGDWATEMAQIKQGDVLLLYTDGVIDALNFEQDNFGSQRLLATAHANLERAPMEMQDAIMSEVRNFVGGETQFDDMTMVVIKRE